MREQEQAESSNHAGATKQDSLSSDEDDKYDSEEEDAAGANLLKKSKLHDDEYLERKMSKI